MTAAIAIRAVIGGAMVLYALIVFALRIGGKDHAFRKLGPMRQAYGPRAGSAIHYAGYVVMPLLFGTWLLATAFGLDPLAPFR